MDTLVNHFQMAAVTTVHDFLASLSAQHRHAQISRSMVFPKTNSVKEKPENATLVIEYECINGLCDFTIALEEVSKNVILNDHWSTADVCIDIIIKDIAAYPDDYLPDKVYVFLSIE